ncbi:MAG: hypothetical protein K940chlam2_00392 [Chlamydiae bacterium]|nr:hypothetical protein [Chlamydiota bacterium]
MAHPSTSRRTAKVISLGCFLIALAIVTYLQTWWPAIMLVVGIPLAIRQYLLGRHYDVGVTLFVFLGVFITVQFDISWEILLPVLFTIGGIYIFVREFLERRTTPEAEEELNQELEEDEHKKKKP